MAPFSITCVTNDLDRPVAEHQAREVEGFTKKYNATRLVWFEEFEDIREAIEYEKEIKGWRRAKKERLIRSFNPELVDLSQRAP